MLKKIFKGTKIKDGRNDEETGKVCEEENDETDGVQQEKEEE
jgi:hypothetical protein